MRSGTPFPFPHGIFLCSNFFMPPFPLISPFCHPEERLCRDVRIRLFSKRSAFFFPRPRSSRRCARGCMRPQGAKGSAHRAGSCRAGERRFLQGGGAFYFRASVFAEQKRRRMLRILPLIPRKRSPFPQGGRQKIAPFLKDEAMNRNFANSI